MKNNFTGLATDVQAWQSLTRNPACLVQQLKQQVLKEVSKNIENYITALIPGITCKSNEPPCNTCGVPMTEICQKKLIISWIISLCNAAALFELDYDPTGRRIDLYIILSPRDERGFKELEPFIRAATLGKWEVQFSLCQLSLFNERRKQGSLFYNVRCNEKALLYRSESVPLSFTDDACLQLLLVKAAETFEKSCMKGRRFFEKALQFENEKEHALACFAIHQAVEITLRGFVAAFSGIYPRQHSIKQLLLLCNRIRNGFMLFFQTAAESEVLKCLEEAYIEARYNNDFTVTDEVLLLLKKKATHIFAFTGAVFKELLHTYTLHLKNER